MATVVKTTFQFKRGSAAKWAELNLVLAAGEPGFELDTGRLKIGDGVRAWQDLPYLGGGENGNLPIDFELSEFSNNAIANKTVTKALKDLEAKILETPLYSFGEGFHTEVIDGIQTISLDVDYIQRLIPEIDLSDYATKSDLAGLATEEFVLQKIAEIEFPSTEVDLSNYYTKEEVNDLIPSTQGLASIEYVNNQTTEITNLLETNYITVEQGVTKEELSTEVREVVGTEVETIIEEKLAEGVAVTKIEYGTF